MNVKIQQNALVQKMGDIYHYYIAINLLLKNNDWAKCLIEQSGDIGLLDNAGKQIFNIEVKHHNNQHELKIYEEEFQKTLYNWFNIKELFTSETKLILMTSSTISTDNPLKHWNQFTDDKKYKTLLENQRKQDKAYYSNISKYFHTISKNIDKLKDILKILEIKHSIPNISKIRELIKTNNHFRLFRDNEIHKDKVIDDLYGLIGRGLENKDKWEITKEEFDQKLKESTTLAQNKILRTDHSIDTQSIDRDINNYKEKQFIKKLSNIEFTKDIFQLAIDDYAKSIIEITERMRLGSSLEFDERLELYDESLIRLVNETKIEYNYENTLSDIQKSQKSYFQVMKSTKIPFMPEEFADQTTFFQKGYLHILADDENEPQKICWSLKSEDLI